MPVPGSTIWISFIARGRTALPCGFGLCAQIDPGNYNKGVLGGWHIDGRDPTADVRLLEFCLAVPTEQFLSNGIQRALARRALADRLPKLVLENSRRGCQAADWHERLTAVRERVAIELDQLEACPAAAKTLDLPRLHRTRGKLADLTVGNARRSISLIATRYCGRLR